MSAESEFKAMLAAYAPLAALVADRIAQNAIDQGVALPYIVFTAAHAPQQLLDGEADDQVTLSTQCWGRTAVEAAAVAVQVAAAVAAFDNASTSTCATVLSSQSAFDADTGLDGVMLDVEWWT